MTLLTLQDAELAFGLHPLLDRANLVVGEGERIGLIGRNGTGKSSLLQVIAGQRQLDDGEMKTRDGLSVVLVEQEPELPRASSLRECLALRGKLEAIHDERDRWRTEARLVEYLHRFGLDEATAPESASGGEKKRAALALALALAPDLLLLDEPTNHLDLDGITLVEELVAKAPAAIVITHDRAFLDRVATRIVELDRGLLRSYPGNFTAYESRKAERARRRSGGAAQVRPVLGAGRSVDPQGRRGAPHARRGPRAPARSAAPRAQRAPRAARQREARARCRRALGPARRRALARHQGVRRTHAGARSHAAHHARRPAGTDRRQRRGQVDAAQADPRHAAAGFGHGAARHEARRSRISTSCAKQLDGERTLAETISPGSEWVETAGGRKHVLSYLGDFLFPPQRADTPVRALSGGERNRLLLARLFARPANLLVLDEPTNDLDIESLELLESTLQTYPGTLLLVSHDRTFLDNVVTQTLVAESRDGTTGTWHEYPGGYSDWVAQRPERDGAAGGRAARSRPRPPPAKAAGTPPARAAAARTQAHVRRAARARSAAGRDRGAGTRAARAHRADVPRRLPPRGAGADQGGPGARRGDRARARRGSSSAGASSTAGTAGRGQG